MWLFGVTVGCRADAASAVAMEVECDVIEAEIRKVISGCPDELGIKSGVEFLGSGLDPGESIVVPNAEQFESPRPQECFGLFDSREFFFSDVQAGWNP